MNCCPANPFFLLEKGIISFSNRSSRLCNSEKLRGLSGITLLGITFCHSDNSALQTVHLKRQVNHFGFPTAGKHLQILHQHPTHEQPRVRDRRQDSPALPAEGSGKEKAKNERKSSQKYSPARLPAALENVGVLGRKCSILSGFFPPQMVTPGPATYQPFLGDERRCQPAYVPFSSSSPRFPTRLLEKDLFPG